MNEVVIIGAGIVGLTTACRMAESGYKVTVLEQRSEPGAGSSKANAGQLLYNNISAMASPSFLRSLPKTLLNPDQGVIVNGLLRPKSWPWLGKFIGQCTNKSWRKNTKNIIMLAQRSRQTMQDFNQRYDIDFNWRQAGKIIIHENKPALLSAEKIIQFQQQFGAKYKLLSKEECLEREPALQGTNRQFFGGIYLGDAEVGDCHVFCQKLAEILVDKLGGKIKYNIEVENFEKKHQHVIAVRTNEGRIESDIFIIAAGIGSSKLLTKSFPIKKPIMAIKGISLTYPIGRNPPDLSVTDAAAKFVILRLADQVRVAGYAIFSDDLNIKDDHVRRLQQKAKNLMPEAAAYDQAPTIWTGLRPQTPNEEPMIGRAGAENLYVNAGHGSIGWILAFGCAETTLDIIKRNHN